MSNSTSLGFGGFLVGLGVGWVVFQYIEVTSNLFSWILILVGVSVIAGAIFSRSRPRNDIGGLVSGVMGGLILSLFITSGFGFFGDITRGGFSGVYRYKNTESFSGAVTEDSVYLDVANFNGPITVSTWTRAEYSVDLTIGARVEGDLDDIVVDFWEGGTPDQKRLTLEYDVAPTDRSKYAIEVEVHLPADAVMEFDLTSNNGGIYLTDVTGSVLTLTTSNGPIEFDDVSADRINGGTSNARIEGSLEAPVTYLSTSNGKISLTLPCTVTGDYVLLTSNGGIDLEVSSSSSVGYDLDLSTSNGEVDIDLPDLSYRTNTRTVKVAETSGFDSKAVQIAIEGSTSNSGIDVDT